MAGGVLNGLLGGAGGPADTEEGRMPFLAHLGELRHRIVVSLIAVAVGFVLTFNFSEPIINWLALPLRDAHPTESTDPGRRLPSAPDVDARGDARFPRETDSCQPRRFVEDLARAG